MAGKKLENWLKVSEITEKLHLSERAILEERENPGGNSGGGEL
jgi:hypothetical protein